MSDPASADTAVQLRGLIGHREFVRATDTLEMVQQRFQTGSQDFMGVLSGRALAGLCSRRDVGNLLGSRYGFALHGRALIGNHLSAGSIWIRANDPLTDVLQAVASRADEHFYDDVLLVDAAGDFLGLIPVRALVRLQTDMLLGNLEATAARNRQMEDDLRMAREVQVAMLPREYPTCRAPDGSFLHFAQLYEPAGGVSGDFFDILPVSPTAAGIIICDVMGHGVRSALITAMVRTMIEELRPYAGDPAAMLTQLNAHLTKLLRRTGDMIFVTAAYVVVDADSRRLTYAQAGHPTPLHWTSRAGLAAPLPGTDALGGPALGLVDDHVFAAATIDFAAGDRVLLFTDGIFEAENAEGIEFGPARLATAWAQATGGRLEDKLTHVRSTAVNFCGRDSFADDICLIVCELGVG